MVSPGSSTSGPRSSSAYSGACAAITVPLYLSALGTGRRLRTEPHRPHPAPRLLGVARGQCAPLAKSPEAQLDKWLKKLQQYNDLFYNTVDGVVSALYEYHKVIEAEYPHVPMVYGGIPVDRDPLPAMRIRPDGEKSENTICRAPKPRSRERTDKLRPLLDRLVEEMPQDVEIVAPPNMPSPRLYPCARRRRHGMRPAILLYPRHTALLGMAMGVVPISGGEELFYDFIGEDTPACIQPRPARPRRHICAAPGTRCRQSRTASYERRSPPPLWSGTTTP